MKKQILLSTLLIMIALILALAGSVIATNQIEPRTGEGVTNNTTTYIRKFFNFYRRK